MRLFNVQMIVRGAATIPKIVIFSSACRMMMTLMELWSVKIRVWDIFVHGKYE